MPEYASDEVLDAQPRKLESEYETALRPRTLAEFVGQRQVIDNLGVFVAAARKRGEPLDHILFSGMPGLGKTTLANLIAHEMEVGMHATSGPALERAGDLVSLLTNLGRGDVLFIDEIHRMPKAVEEYLYSAMEDWHIDIVLDQGPAARSVRVSLQRFTLVGATTREGLLSAPFRARFGVLERLDPYPVQDLLTIVRRSAGLLGTPIVDDAATLIASRSRGTPRVANRILRRLRDVAQVKGNGKIDVAIAEQGLRMLGIDGHGLTELDRRILRCLAGSSTPVGLKTVAVAVGEEEDTIEDTYEPHLIREGLVQKTPRGRVVTEKGRAVL
jgi:Holliday junction DNA helicase RuvB